MILRKNSKSLFLFALFLAVCADPVNVRSLTYEEMLELETIGENDKIVPPHVREKALRDFLGRAQDRTKGCLSWVNHKALKRDTNRVLIKCAKDRESATTLLAKLDKGIASFEHEDFQKARNLFQDYFRERKKTPKNDPEDFTARVSLGEFTKVKTAAHKIGIKGKGAAVLVFEEGTNTVPYENTEFLNKSEPQAQNIKGGIEHDEEIQKIIDDVNKVLQHKEEYEELFANRPSIGYILNDKNQDTIHYIVNNEANVTKILNNQESILKTLDVKQLGDLLLEYGIKEIPSVEMVVKILEAKEHIPFILKRKDKLTEWQSRANEIRIEIFRNHYNILPILKDHKKELTERINRYLVKISDNKHKNQHAPLVAGILHQIAPESYIVVKSRRQASDAEQMNGHITGNPWLVVNTSFGVIYSVIENDTETATSKWERLVDCINDMPNRRLWVQSFGNDRLSDQKRPKHLHNRFLPELTRGENIILAVNIDDTFSPHVTSDLPDDYNREKLGMPPFAEGDLAIIQASTLSALGSEIIGASGNEQFQRESGTSLSAPVISGVATLLKSAFPELTEWEVRDILLASAEREFHIPATQANKKGVYFYDPAKTCTAITRNNEKEFVYQEFPKSIYGQGIVSAERAFFFAQLYVCFQKTEQGNDIVPDNIRWLKARYPALYPVLLEKMRGFAQQKRAQFVSAVHPGRLEWVESLEEKRKTFEQFWCIVEKWQAATVKEFLSGLKHGKKVVKEAESAAQHSGLKHGDDPQYNDFYKNRAAQVKAIAEVDPVGAEKLLEDTEKHLARLKSTGQHPKRSTFWGHVRNTNEIDARLSEARKRVEEALSQRKISRQRIHQALPKLREERGAAH